MSFMEVFRFGHRDWYNGDCAQHTLQSSLHNDISNNNDSSNNNSDSNHNNNNNNHNSKNSNDSEVDAACIGTQEALSSGALKPSVHFEDEYFRTPLFKRIAWHCALRLTSIHVLAFAALFHLHRLSWSTWAFEFVYLVLAALSVTAGAHRLWTHRSYRARLPLRVVLMLANTVAAQNDLYEWCRNHRVHHKYSDTNADPHNIERGLFFSHVGWLLIRKHPDVYRFGSRIDCSDLLADPVVRFNMRYYGVLVLIFAFLVPTLGPHLVTGDPVVALLLVCFLRLAVSLNFTWAVNSFAHWVGDKPFNRDIRPSEVPLVSLLTVGEGWHNYHHTFPHDYSCSELGWHINLTTVMIDAMAWLGQVSDRRTISKKAILKQKLRNGDGHRLPRRIRELPQWERLQLAEDFYEEGQPPTTMTATTTTATGSVAG